MAIVYSLEPTDSGNLFSISGTTLLRNGTLVAGNSYTISVKRTDTETSETNVKSFTITATAAETEDTSAASYLNAQTTAPSSVERSRVDALVKGLKSDGDWASFDWIVLIASETAQAARLNLRNPAKSMSAINLPVFTANRGYQGDGSSSYLTYGERLNASGNQYALNSATVGAWCNLQGASGVRPHFGAVSDSLTEINVRDTSGNQAYSINSTNSILLAWSGEARTGHRSLCRRSSSAASIFLNGEAKISGATLSSTSSATSNVCLLRAIARYADDRLALAYSGAGFSDAALVRIHNRFNTYLNSKGAA